MLWLILTPNNVWPETIHLTRYLSRISTIRIMDLILLSDYVWELHSTGPQLSNGDWWCLVRSRLARWCLIQLWHTGHPQTSDTSISWFVLCFLSFWESRIKWFENIQDYEKLWYPCLEPVVGSVVFFECFKTTKTKLCLLRIPHCHTFLMVADNQGTR